VLDASVRTRAMQEERRHSQRARTLRAGKIVFNNKSSVIDCRVRNVSTDGACLMVASVVGIPSAFELLIDGEAASRPCKRVWHTQNRIGIEFSL
jgi:PilZ domain